MANEIAIAIARTRKPGGEFITFSGSYFGRSAGTVGFAGKSRYRQALGVPKEAHVVPYPYPLRMGERASDVSIEASASRNSARTRLGWAEGQCISRPACSRTASTTFGC